MTKEEFDAILLACVDLWSLKEPDVVEAYHAHRVLASREGLPIRQFDDFRIKWKEQQALLGTKA